MAARRPSSILPDVMSPRRPVRGRPTSRWLVAVVLLGILLSACSPSEPSPKTTTIPSPGASGSVSPDASGGVAPSPSPVAKAKWTDCGSGFQCATIRVPKDYADPAKGTLQLALLRLPATDRAQRIGSLLINPGGPGGSGVDFVRDGASQFPSAIRARFDLVGFDPRGVNTSSPVRCIDNLDPQADLDPSPDNGAELAALVDQQHQYADACARRNADVLPYLSTAAVVDDLDTIRAAVGDEKLSYLGFSYGTLIGSMYADKYPEKIRAMVLDGAIDPSLGETQLRTGQAKAFEGALRRMLAKCSKSSSCPFFEGGRSLKAFDALMAKIEKKPLPILRFAGRRKVGPGLTFSAVLGSLYNPASYRALELALARAKAGDGRLLVLLSDPFRGRKPSGSYSNQYDAYYSNTCLDFPVSTDVADFKALAETFRKVAPHFRAAAFNDLACAYWSVPAERTPAPASAAGAPPIVVVGSTGDPATPYQWAKNLAGQLESGTLITRQGEGHTGYVFSTCVQKAADAYLLEGTVPKKNLVCK